MRCTVERRQIDSLGDLSQAQAVSLVFENSQDFCGSGDDLNSLPGFRFG